MTTDDLKNTEFFTNLTNPELWGPLAGLAGIWEGEKGKDLAPADDRSVETNLYKERLILEPMTRVDNHEQILYGLRYSTVAWRIGEDSPFHEELGYWLWDAKTKMILRCFVIPRGICVLAGGMSEPDAKQFQLSAKLGSETYGILSNEFLDQEFKTIRYDLTVTLHSAHEFSYEEDTQLQIKGQKEIFHHRDQNRLRKIL